MCVCDRYASVGALSLGGLYMMLKANPEESITSGQHREARGKLADTSGLGTDGTGAALRTSPRQQQRFLPPNDVSNSRHQGVTR